MNNIRVTYSGLIAFSVSLVGVITGILFTVIVTRKLSPEDFGLWTLIGSMISYVIVYEPILSFWVSRQIARGSEIGKTAIISSGIFSIISLIAYIGVSFLVFKSTNSDLDILLFATILVPLNFLSNTLRGINLGFKPQATSFSILFFEIFKIPFGLTLVYFLDLGLVGAIFAVAIALGIKIIIQIYFAKSKIYGIFDKQKIKYWLRLSWLPLYGIAPSFIYTLDVLIYSTLVGSVVGLSFYGAAMAVGNVVVHSAMISQALYPKLLSDGKKEHIEENFTKLLYFSIPLLTLTILLGKSGLFILNPIYVEAYTIVIFYSVRSFLHGINGTFYKILQGLDKTDTSEVTSFSILLKSKLFLVPTIQLVHYSSYASGLVILLLILIPHESSDIELITTWSMLGLFLQIPFTIFSGLLVYKRTKFKFSLKDISKYILVAVLMAFIFYLSEDLVLSYDESIFVFVPEVFLQVFLCSISYLGITYLIDKKTRIMLKSIFRELVFIIKNSSENNSK